MSETLPIRFFLGANSPQGFVSRFDQLDYGDPQWHTFIIKGGPGCGKSSFLKRLSSIFAERSPRMEEILCSSDPDSLDALILPEWKVSIADGTAPHILEPRYPAVSESILSFGDFLDPIKLKPHSETIRQINRLISKNYTQAVNCLAAARSFLNDSSRIEVSCLNLEKLSAYASHFAARNFPRRSASAAQERVRFLSSFHAQGMTLLTNSIPSLCPKLCFVCDDCGGAAPLFLSALRSRALENGYSPITCFCPLAPHSRIDHLLLPELGMAFLTENRFHDLSGLQPQQRIHAKRFWEDDIIRRHKKRISFSNKAAAQMIGQAVGILSENKELHDRLEELYLPAMDFSLMDAVLEEVVAQIVDFRLVREGGKLL